MIPIYVLNEAYCKNDVYDKQEGVKLKKRSMLLFLFTFFVLAPFASAQARGPGDLVLEILGSILKVFSFDWLRGHSGIAVDAFVRFVIWLFLFIIFFEVTTTRLVMGRSPFFTSRARAGVVSAIIALISTMFMPINLLLLIGTTYSSIISILLLAIPLGMLVFLLFRSGRWFPGNPRTRALFNIGMIALLWILTSLMINSL